MVQKELKKKAKKIAYITLFCLSAIAAIASIQSYNLLADRPKLPDNAVANAAQLELQEFPIGWIDRIERPQTPATVAKEGIDLLIPYTHSYEQPTIETYLEAALKNGIKVFLEPYRKPVETGDAAAVTEFIKTYKNHPAVAGWYAYDEPAIKDKVLPSTLEITYRAIKAEDPEHPVAVVFANGQIAKIPQYWNAMDICMIDRYPLFYNKPEFDNLNDFGSWMQKAEYYTGNKPFIPVLQGYGEQEDGKPKYRRRLPTAAEERYMFYTAVATGADGLMFYGHHWTRQSWVDSVLTPIIKEFRDYLPIVVSKKVNEKSLTKRSDIQTALYKYPNTQQYLLIAIHHGRGKVKAKIEPQVAVSNKLIQVSGENRRLNLTKGTFQDTFSDYEVHIYVIS